MDVKLDAYSGPLDLLLQLIEKNKINIHDIPIAEITDQYLEQIRDPSFPQRDMDSLSDFLLMAAFLLEIKSATLLPKPDPIQGIDELDPRVELANRLAEYKMYKELSEVLKDNENRGALLFFRQPEPLLRNSLNEGDSTVKSDVSDVLDGLTINTLYAVFEDILKRREMKTDKVRAGFNSIKRDLYSVGDKIKHISGILANYGKVAFLEIFDECRTKPEKIVTFLAMLELIKMKKIHITQKNTFGEIIITDWINENILRG